MKFTIIDDHSSFIISVYLICVVPGIDIYWLTALLCLVLSENFPFLTIAGEELQKFTAFKQKLIFTVPHLLRHGTLVYKVSYDNQRISMIFSYLHLNG